MRLWYLKFKWPSHTNEPVLYTWKDSDSDFEMAFEIIQLPKDPDGIRDWVEKYKAFRLYSLQTAPEAFGSTYAREIAFGDEVWNQRLTNPEAATFVALQSGKIVSTITAVGPLAFWAEE
jgi:hypothetical protein